MRRHDDGLADIMGGQRRENIAAGRDGCLSREVGSEPAELPLRAQEVRRHVMDADDAVAVILEEDEGAP